MEEELKTNNTEILEDMPDFGENTAKTPCESEKSVDECTDDAENAIVSEENEPKTEEKAEEKAETPAEDKSNLPYGFSFNPLVIAIKPFYEQAIAEDELFAKEVKEKESRAEKPKSLAECADYIMGEAYKYAKAHQQGGFGLAGFPDEMMPSLIKHYYDEDDIVIKRFNDAKVSVKTDTKPSAPVVIPTPKTAKKGKEKAKPVKNVIDFSKIVSAKQKTEDGKKVKMEKKKDNLKAGFVPMERPDTLKDAKKGSREQAKSVEQMDMFADFFANEE